MKQRPHTVAIQQEQHRQDEQEDNPPNADIECEDSQTIIRDFETDEDNYSQRPYSDTMLMLGNGGDTSSMTVRDRQEAINESHPFGIRLWKPALYKKTRTIENITNLALHQPPPQSFSFEQYLDGNSALGGPFHRLYRSTRAFLRFLREQKFVSVGNLMWAFLFGWWMFLVYAAGLCLFLAMSSPMLLFTSRSSHSYKHFVRYRGLLYQLAFYVLWPFGKYIKRKGVELSSVQDEILVPTHSPREAVGHPHLINSYLSFSSGDLDEEQPLLSSSSAMGSASRKTIFDYLFYILYFLLLAPLHYLVSFLNFVLVVGVPMAKLNSVLASHLYHNPRSLCTLSSSTSVNSPCEIILCTYSAFGAQYFKYTYDGINILFYNMLLIVVFALFDGFFLTHWIGGVGIAHPMVVFCLCLLSVVPLAYFIGTAVASISSQSSLGLGAVINASFGSIVEIILYFLMLVEGKGLLVEGAIIGSFLGMLLLLPGVSMIAGGVGRFKEQVFNVKSQSVSTVLLIMAQIGAFTPTIFYSVFGRHELTCRTCDHTITAEMTATDIMARCSGCNYVLPKDLSGDPFYQNNIRPLMYICAAILPSAYIIGLWFTLRTHVKQIYHDKKHESLISPVSTQNPSRITSIITAVTNTSTNHNANRRASNGSRRSQTLPMHGGGHSNSGHTHHPKHDHEEHDAGGHDAPEWSKTKSTSILLVSTLLFAMLAELLVQTVDQVIESMHLDPKFLGLTLFALVPSFTEFLNAIMFASYGNVALSLEIGSAYVTQVALIQVPSLVVFSAVWNYYNGTHDTPEKSFTLIFPQWDAYTVFFGVFLLSYTLLEGKSNYFKGSILTLSYIVLIMSFYFI